MVHSINNREDLQSLQKRYRKKGFVVKDNFIDTDECEQLLRSINQFKETHPLEEIYRKGKDRSLHYFVIDGEKIERYLPEIFEPYIEMGHMVNEICRDDMMPLENKKAGININITPEG